MLDEDLCLACGHPPADGHTGVDCQVNCPECLAADDPRTARRFRYQVIFGSGQARDGARVERRLSSFRSRDAANAFIRLLTYHGTPARLWTVSRSHGEVDE